MVTHIIEEAVQVADRILVMDKDPGRLAAEITVGLHQPRRREDVAFQALVDRVHARVAGENEPAPTPDQPPPSGRRLPQPRLNALAA